MSRPQSHQSTLPLPPIRTSLTDAKADLDAIGLTRVANAAPARIFEEARERLIEQAAGEDAANVAHRDPGDTADPTPGAPNQRVWNLLNKGKIFRELTLNPVVLELIRHVLGNDILLFSITANIACRGGKAMGLHGDQIFAPADISYPLLANCLWMLDDFTPENGATRVVPCSHTFGYWPKGDTAIDHVPATGPAGTVMLWDGRLWHGTGVNETAAPRHGVLSAFSRAFVRPQENHTVSVSDDVLREAPDELLRLLGFEPYMGMGMIDGALRTFRKGRPQACIMELDRRGRPKETAEDD